MDFVLDSDLGIKNRKIISFEGFAALKKYLKNVEVEKLNEKIALKLKTYEERDIVRTRAPYLWGTHELDTNIVNESAITGSPIMMAMLIGEYDIVKELLSKAPLLSREYLGNIDRSMNCFGFGESGYGCYELEGILYEPSANIPDELRALILNRLHDEFGDMGIEMRFVKDMTNIESLKKIKQDAEKMPFIFKGIENLRVGNLETVLFLVRLISDKNDLTKFLKSIVSMQNSYLLVKGITNGCNTPEESPLFKITTVLMKKKEVNHELYIFLLKLLNLTERTGMSPISGEIDTAAAIKVIWECIYRIDFDDNEFERLLEAADSDYAEDINFTMQVYELYKNRMGRKSNLRLTDARGDELVTFFRCLFCETDMSFFSCGPNTAELKRRLVNLLENIEDIEYGISDEESLYGNYDLRHEIATLLTRNSDLLEDSFLELLEKGLIPDEYLDYMIKRVMNNKKCAYMVPFLIMQKYGGLVRNEK